MILYRISIIRTAMETALMETKRPDKEEYFLEMARLIGTRATCPRRQVGCVLVDKNNHVLATGYNGVPRRINHCTERPCPGAGLPSGEGLELCRATHAEQNALLQCSDTMAIHTVYCTAQPCFTCTKLIMNTGAVRVLFLDSHPDPAGREMWLEANSSFTWVQYEGTIK